jgi:tetratricopeptide (TPR) repeat protein
VRSSLELKGDFYFGGQQFDKAYQFFLRAIDDQDFMKQNWPDPSFVFDTSVVADAATVSFLSGKKDQAVTYYESLVKMSYNRPEIYNDLANIYLEDGKSDAAITVLENAVKRFPDDPGILSALIDIYTLQKEFDKALPLAEHLAAVDANNSESLFKAGEVYSVLATTEPANSPTYFDKAESLFKKSIALNGQDFDAQYELAYLYYQHAMTISDAMEKNKDDASSKKQMAERDAMFQKSIGCFEKANTTKPNDVNVLKMLKALYMLTLQYDKAQIVANKLYQMGADK